MTFPGAETMKAGIIGVEALRSRCARGLRLELLAEPLRWVCSISSRRISTVAGMAVGDIEGLLVYGVWIEVAPELDLEEVL